MVLPIHAIIYGKLFVGSLGVIVVLAGLYFIRRALRAHRE
jgi:hypothetical protein